MRKLAREAVIFTLVGTFAVLFYYASIFQQRMYAEHGWVRVTWIYEFATPETLGAKFTPTSIIGGFVDIITIFFMELGWEPLIGLPAGLAVWALYRLVRFAIQG